MNDETAVPAEQDGLSAELAAAAPRRWWNKGTIGLGVAALLMGGFLGGVQAQKQWGATETSATSRFPGGGTRGSGGFPAGLSAGGAPGGVGQQAGGAPAGSSTTASAGTTGKVKLVNGKTIYVETEDGTVVTVKTGSDTTISAARKGKLSDVKAGDSITVHGAAADDGSVTATSVTTVTDAR